MMDRLLRWGFCAIWVFALFMAFEEFLARWAADTISDQTQCGHAAIISMGVFIVAIVAHSYLIPRKDDSDEPDLFV